MKIRSGCALAGMLGLTGLVWAQESAADPRERVKTVRELAKTGSSNNMPELRGYLKDQNLEVRVEAVKAIVNIGTHHSLDPLIEATADDDAEIQIRATDGLVNFYYPDYVRTGFTATLRRVGTSIKGRFTDTNDQVIDRYVEVRLEVIQALGKLARSGVTLEVRANAARAIGVLRGRAAIPDLIAAIKTTKDTQVIYESLVAMRKIGDPAASPGIAFLLNDFDKRVQVNAIETTGLLQNKEALPPLIAV
jgi:HEAT repeat protein